MAIFLSVSFFVIHRIDKQIGVSETTNMFASVFFTQSINTNNLQEKFNTATTTGQKIRILLVPGHEPDFGGAEFKNLKERDMVIDLERNLSEYLKTNPRYEVFVTRDKERWNPELQNYFIQRAEEIKVFTSSQKTEMARLVAEGRIIRVADNAPHNTAPDDVALRLYGINKWANENKIDITLHLHLNDSFPRKTTQAGEYSGLSIYVPEKQYSNSQATGAVASRIFKRLTRFFPISNLPEESEGVVEEQDLIAVGSYNTSDGVSMLIEYGYIYEKGFMDSGVREAVLKELAFQTYLGLEDFFGGTPSIAEPYKTTLLPYFWKTTLKKSSISNKETLSLQASLLQQGFYPPNNKTKNECPLSGVFGLCTRTAVANFQNEHNIPGDGTVFGVQTRAKLNKLYR